MAKTKEETFDKIFRAVVKLEISKGHLVWKMSELSRSAKISRSLIYHYFGKSKIDIVLTATKYLASECLGLSESRIQLWKKGEAYKSIIISRKLVHEDPHLLQFYCKWRYRSSEMQDIFIQSEKQYLKKLKLFYPHLDTSDRLLFLGLLVGFTITPSLTERQVAISFKRLVELVEL